MRSNRVKILVKIMWLINYVRSRSICETRNELEILENRNTWMYSKRTCEFLESQIYLQEEIWNSQWYGKTKMMAETDKNFGLSQFYKAKSLSIGKSRPHTIWTRNYFSNFIPQYSRTHILNSTCPLLFTVIFKLFYSAIVHPVPLFLGCLPSLPCILYFFPPCFFSVGKSIRYHFVGWPT